MHPADALAAAHQDGEGVTVLGLCWHGPVSACGSLWPHGVGLWRVGRLVFALADVARIGASRVIELRINSRVSWLQDEEP